MLCWAFSMLCSALRDGAGARCLKSSAREKQLLTADCKAHLVIVKLQPLLAVWADESAVVAEVHAFAVHEHAVQLVQIPDGLI